MRMVIVGLAVATGLAGCAPALHSREAECDRRAITHGMCGARVPRGEPRREVDPTMQVRLVTHKDLVRHH